MLMANRFGILIVLLLAGHVSACGTGDSDSDGSTARRFRHLAAHLDSAGTPLPATLDELCARSLFCGMSDSTLYFLDAWGARIRYTVANGSYELTSAGADGTWSTGDDLVFSPALEPRLRNAFAGCYRLEAAGLPAILHLDTVELASRVYRTGPDPEWQRGRWWPISAHSAAVRRYESPHHSTILRVHADGDAVRIRRLSRPGGEIAGKRVPCPAF